MVYLITCAFTVKPDLSYLNRHTETTALINVVI